MPITIEALQAKCIEFKTYKEEIEEKTAYVKEMNKALDLMKKEIIEHLAEHGLDKFDFGEGAVSAYDRFAIKIQDKHAVCRWLEANDFVPEDHMTFNFNSFNTFYRERLEEAKETGDVDFHIDGTGDETHIKQLRLTKKKG